MSANEAAAATPVVEKEVDNTIKNPEVSLKFKKAALIAQGALTLVVEKSVEGAKIIDLCKAGDEYMVEEVKKVYKGKKMSKGIAFPTCVSLNNIACHVSPLSSDPEAEILLQKGDLVKIELGAQIDGFPAVMAHSFVVGASKDEPVTGRKADVMLAAYYAAEAAFRLVRPGHTSYEVTDTVQKVCESFDTKPSEGSLSHNLEKEKFEGSKQIIMNPSEMQRKNIKSFEFLPNEVYNIVVVASTSQGKFKETSVRTTVYSRTDSNYSLKMKAAKQVNNEIKTFGKFPFTLRSLPDEKNARMGIVECSRSGIVTRYDVVGEKSGEFVATFMYTVLVQANGNVRVTNYPVDLDLYKSEKKIEDEEILKLLATDVTRKPKVSKPKADKTE